MGTPLFQEDAEGVSLRLRVQPGASGNEVVGVVDGVLRLRLTARPVQGAANQKCLQFLSKKLHVAKSKIMIVKGERSRDKIVRVAGLTGEQVRQALFPGSGSGTVGKR
jgi:uncharacterized protein (TIGR00251 family)